MRRIIVHGLVAFVALGSSACADKPEGSSANNTPPRGTGTPMPSGSSSTDDETVESRDDAGLPPNSTPGERPPEPDTRPPEQVLCETGQKVVAQDGAADFSSAWTTICKGANTSDVYRDVIANAFDGTGEPKVRVLNMKTNDMYVTQVDLIFALKTKLKDPSHVIGLKLHDIFAKGIAKDNSDMVINVRERTPFPPNTASVERSILDYDLRAARGAGIYDVRTTEFNNYQLSDVRKDVSVGTEHLIDVEKNEHYHDAKGLMISISYQENETYIIFYEQLTIKNRFDTKRLEYTLVDLKAVVAKMASEHIANNAGN